MLADKYGEAIQDSQMQEAERKGLAEGCEEEHGVNQRALTKRARYRIGHGKTQEQIVEDSVVEAPEIQPILDVIDSCASNADGEAVYQKVLEKDSER